MKLSLRILLLFALIGSVFWIYKTENEIEPYVTAFASFAAFIGSFIEKTQKDKAEPLINIELVKTGHNKHSFIISNTTSANAYDINIEFKNNKIPIPQNLYNDTFPIKTIFGNDYKEVIAALSFGTGISFDLTWNWKNKKGKSFSRENTVSLKS